MVGKLVVAAAVSALALVAVQGASAKGDIQICGMSGCAVLGAEGQAPAWLFETSGVPSAVTPPAPAPYFVISFGDAGGSPLGYWIPSASVLRLQGQPWRWVPALSSDEAFLHDRTVGLQPYAPPAHPSIYDDYDPVKRCDGYLRLLSMGTPVSVSPHAGNWLEIWFMGAHRSPWTDGTTSLAISRKGSLLRRDGQVFRIPLTVAKRVRARLPLS
jgi:hypothetical protein